MAKKKEIAFDETKVKEYIQRLFTIEQEMQTLRDDKRYLKDELKNKVDIPLVNKIISLVKSDIKISASPDTKEEVKGLVRDKIGMVVNF